MIKKIFENRRIPLAWLLLTRQPLRILVAIAGISFAGILMFMQLGFRDGLFDASVTVHRLFDADLVLMSDRLQGVPEALLLARKTMVKIRQNLFWAFAYNLIAIPIAISGLLNPMWAALFMAFSDIIVIGNSIIHG